MSDSHQDQDGPIHQAGWVFFVAVGAAYAVLTLIMIAKWLGGESDFGLIAKLFGIEAGVLAVFLVGFAGLIYVANKMIGAADQS